MLVLKKYYFLVLFLFSLFVSAKASKIDNFIIYYSDKAPETEFSNYSLLVFDSEYHPDFQALKEEDKIILGYISLGEIEKSRWYFNKFLKNKLFIKENSNWTNSYYVDIRNKQWIEFVIEELVPWILQKKFNGIFIDTLDNPIELERSDPEKFKGMTKAAIHLVKAIRHNYPQIKIMMNRAYELLPELGNVIDYELGEGVYTDYNFKTKKYFFVSEEEYKSQVEKLHTAMNKYPKLKVFTLDYWYPGQLSVIKKIYNKEYRNKFIPYVSDIELNKIIPKPK